MKIYQDHIKKYNTETLRLKKELKSMSFLRLFIFILSTAIIFYLISVKLFTPFFIVLLISIVLFAIVLTRYNKIAYLRKHSAFLEEINSFEMLRQESNLEEFDTGQKFINPKHPYTSDLDIFGEHSIFQLINRTTTESGRILLAKWLSEPAPKKEILDRQNAIKELTQRFEWRQDFQASGMHFENKKSDFSKLLDWVDAPVELLENRLAYTAGAMVLAMLSLLGVYFALLNFDASNWYVYSLGLLAVLFVNYLVLRKVEAIADTIVLTSQKNINTLRSYQALINKIEEGDFESEKLVGLKSVLAKNEYSASKEIEKICQLLDFSQQRGINKIKMPIKGNPFYTLLNSFLLVDIHLIIGAEKWKSKNKTFLKSWADLVSQFEVINSFAGFYYSNASFTFPSFVEKSNYFHFEALGHPLINASQRICNDFGSAGPGDIVMVTGSNMGGKSTFLRTVGVNLVLALAGAPCCAQAAEVSILKLFTSMRTQDNLKAGISSFYAELNRIEKMLKLIESNTNIYFLLDEIFKGTNSEDRHKGGFSLINQISKLKASGIIATHDIELAKLSGTKKLVKNYSFNSEIKDKAMIFSYELEPKICHDFNASELMKRSGIEIIGDSSKSEME